MVIKQSSSMNDTRLELGKRVKRQRVYSQLTQAELANRSGVSVRTIVNLESGKDVSFGNFIAVAKALDSLQDFDGLFSSSAYPADINMRTQKERQRVKKPKIAKRKNAWKWGDER